MQQNSTQHETFLYEEIGHVARITFNRPDTLNALTFEVYAELRDTFRDLNRASIPYSSHNAIREGYLIGIRI